MNDKPSARYTDLCVLRDESIDRWRVLLCDGCSQRVELAAFSSPTAAADFLIEERERRESLGQQISTFHVPDDCPCSHWSPQPPPPANEAEGED